MTNPIEIATRYIEAWNEPDAARRGRLIAQAWAEDAQYLDPMMAGEGHGGIDAMIAGVQQQFPDHRFVLAGVPDGHKDRVRFSWTLCTVNGVAAARGTDFGILAADGRLSSVTGFLDAVSA